MTAAAVSATTATAALDVAATFAAAAFTVAVFAADATIFLCAGRVDWWSEQQIQRGNFILGLLQIQSKIS